MTVTMTNAEWCIKNGIPFRKVGRRLCSDPEYESIGYYTTYGNFNECYKGKCLGDLASESILTWLDMEHKEQVLDDAEKRYLSAVIRPFRNYIQSISKAKIAYCEWLHFELTYDSFSLPLFKPGEMYKGMEPGKKYSLEELGL